MPEIIGFVVNTPVLQCSILLDGQLQIRTTTFVGGTPQYHRHTIFPGQDTINEDVRIQLWCSDNWTPEVITAYDQSLIRE